MHSAPPVSYPVGRSRFAAVTLASLWLLGVLAAIFWWAQAQAPGALPVGGVALLLVGVGAFAAWSWVHAPCGELSWDGESWNWTIAGRADTGTLEVALDLQRWLLLRWSAGRAVRWLWVERAGRSQHWDDVRRAVYSRARPQALRPAQPPATP